jgi:hypothetical protein
LVLERLVGVLLLQQLLLELMLEPLEEVLLLLQLLLLLLLAFLLLLLPLLLALLLLPLLAFLLLLPLLLTLLFDLSLAGLDALAASCTDIAELPLQIRVLERHIGAMSRVEPPVWNCPPPLTLTRLNLL